jgi:hypothetical protein
MFYIGLPYTVCPFLFAYVWCSLQCRQTTWHMASGAQTSCVSKQPINNVADAAVRLAVHEHACVSVCVIPAVTLVLQQKEHTHNTHTTIGPSVACECLRRLFDAGRLWSTPEPPPRGPPPRLPRMSEAQVGADRGWIGGGSKTQREADKARIRRSGVRDRATARGG